MKAAIKRFLYKELFSLNSEGKGAFKYAVADAELQNIFNHHGHPLGSGVTFLTITPRKWKLLDGNRVYLVRDTGDHLMVFLEKHPSVCEFLETILNQSRAKYHDFKLQIRRWYFCKISALKKRWIDKPSKLLINIGAGNWYVRDWKVLEYQGQWYRFSRSFIDYEHNLTSNQKLPFADDSAHLFYSEHVFEHLKDGWCEHTFKEVYRCLKPGGGFRVVVPDADFLYDRLSNRDESFFRSWMHRDNISLAEAFRVLVGHARSPLNEQEFERRFSSMPKEEFFDWCKEGLEYDLQRTGEHINWFNFQKMARMLKAAGFEKVYRSEAQQSLFPEARGPRFDTRAWYSLHVECAK